MSNPGQETKRIRAFVAIYPDATVLKRLQELQDELRHTLQSKSFRWAKPDQLHLTLQFLGSIEPSSLPKYSRVLDEVCKRNVSLVLHAKSLGSFPTPARPRVLWVGLQGNLESLQKLKGDLDGDFQRVGYVPETRPFHPHITLARVESLGNQALRALRDLRTKFENISFGEWVAPSVELMQSVLSPAGARYSVLNSSPLLKQNPAVDV